MGRRDDQQGTFDWSKGRPHRSRCVWDGQVSRECSSTFRSPRSVFGQALFFVKANAIVAPVKVLQRQI